MTRKIAPTEPLPPFVIFNPMLPPLYETSMGHPADHPYDHTAWGEYIDGSTVYFQSRGGADEHREAARAEILQLRAGV